MTNTEIIDLMLEDLKKVSAFLHNTLGVPGFHTEMERLGVRSLQLKNIAKKWNNILFDLSPKRWIELCIQLTQRGIFECQILAYEILWKNRLALKSLTPNQILELGSNLDNWASTDSYCIMIAGWHWREGTLPDSQIMNWLKSEDRWLRRVAVVCTVPLNLRSKGGTGDTRRTLMICEKIVDDRDDMVVKALSWALRELSKSDKYSVEKFMEKYWEQLHPRIRREVKAKLETGRKNG